MNSSPSKISTAAKNRGIDRIVHFTTDSGALGILAAQALVPRAQLAQTELLEYIIHNNCEIRKDPQWTNYNSLSISAINTRFFEYSRKKHSENRSAWWCVFSFSVSILDHDGVYFVTGNNTWPNSEKKLGLKGFEQLFATTVPWSFNRTLSRNPRQASSLPTSPEAEVLYPGKLDFSFVQNVFFLEQIHADQFAAQAATLGIQLPKGLSVVSEGAFAGNSP